MNPTAHARKDAPRDRSRLGSRRLVPATQRCPVSAASGHHDPKDLEPRDTVPGGFAIGVGLLIVGVMVRRTGLWTGWQGWVPLVGVWVFVGSSTARPRGRT